jgi:hypothetical protein
MNRATTSSSNFLKYQKWHNTESLAFHNGNLIGTLSSAAAAGPKKLLQSNFEQMSIRC